MDRMIIKYSDMYGIQLITLDQFLSYIKNIYDVPIYYKPILAASRIAVENILASTYNDSIGQDTELFKLEDDRRYQYIFEKFIRNYYISKLEPLGYSVSKPTYKLYNTHVNSGIQSGRKNPDIVIIKDNKAIVIDTKWYTGKHNIEANRYAIESYVSSCYYSNKKSLTEIHGIVLYAKGVNDDIKHEAFNDIYFDLYTRDLYQDVIDMTLSFDEIKAQLDKIISNVFNESI